MVFRALIASLFAAVVGLAAPAGAQDAAFTVSGVQADITAANAAKAREQAFAEVQSTAYQRLLERLVSDADVGRLPKPSLTEIEALVHDVILENEKSSAVRYIGTFTVRFKPDAVRSALNMAHVPFVERRRSAMVVVPVFVGDDGGATLWDDPNPWRQAWSRRPTDGLVPFVVPLGELADVDAINVEQATVRDEAALAAIARRYEAADVLLTVATLSRGADNSQIVDVEYAGFGPGAGAGGRGEVHIAGRPGERAEALFTRAADAVASVLRDGYKNDAVAGTAPASTPFESAQPSGGQLPALVPLSGMQDWLAVRERLAKLPALKGYEVVSLNRNEAALILHYAGEPAQLQATLAQAGFDLAPGEGGTWLMQPPRPAAVPAQ